MKTSKTIHIGLLLQLRLDFPFVDQGGRLYRNKNTSRLRIGYKEYAKVS